MPGTGYRTLRDVALARGYSQTGSKKIARRIVNHPNFDLIVATFAETGALTYHDPTGDDATRNVLLDALIRNQETVNV